MFVRMELGAGVDQEETILTDPESEEVDETFYMNRLLMLGAAGPLSGSPHKNPCSSHDSGISPQIDVLPGGAQRRPPKNKQINDNPLIYSARRGAVKDDKKSKKVEHMTETVTCRTHPTSVPKSAQTPTTRCLYRGQDAAACKWSLRPFIQNHVGKQERGKSKVVKDKHSKSRPKCMDTTVKEGRLKPRTVLSILSREGQQRPGAKLHTSLGVKNSKAEKAPSVHRIHRRNWFGETLLHIAAVKGDVQSVENMIKVGACVNLTDNAGWTPLHEAVWHGHYTIVETLLKAGAQVNPLGYKGVTPLHDAVKLGCLETIDLLLKHGADPLLKNGSEEAAVDITEDMGVQELLRRYLPTASKKCLSAQSVSCTTSCEENGNEEPCRRARHSADKDEAENNEQSSEIEACVGPDAGSAEKEHDSTKTGGSPKVSSVQTMVPLRDQAEYSYMCGFTVVQNREILGSNTSPSRNSDAESDVTVDYIEPNSSPGHWFLSATQDFSGSTFRLVAETVREDVYIVDGDLHVSQSLLSSDNKGNPSRCKGSSRDSSNDTIKRVWDGSRSDHETVARKKIRRITVSSKPNQFLEYLLNFDLNSVCVLNNGSDTITKRGSGGCASRLNRNVCDYHSDPPVYHKEGLCEDTCASHTQSHSNGECSISLLSPCINGIIESNSEGQCVLDNKTQLVTAVTHWSVPREGSPESSDIDSPSLLMNIIHDHGLTTSLGPQVGEQVLGQLKISGDHLKVTHSSSQTSIKPVTVQSCFDEDLQKQKSVPILNVANEAIKTNNTSITYMSEDNTDTPSNLTSRNMLESSAETCVSTVLPVDQEREYNREAKLSCRQAYVTPPETDGIVNSEMQVGGRSALKLAENSGFFEFPISSACKKKESLASPPSSKSPRDDRIDTNDSQNILTEPGVSVLSPALACVTGDNEDDTRCSADSDCTFIDELEHLKTSKNAMDVIIQTNLNASPCDREKCAKQHGLYKALDERSMAEQIDNATHPLDTEISVTMLRCLPQKPLCLLPAQDNNQSTQSAEDDHLQIAVENEELKYSNKPRKHKIKVRRRKFQKQSNKVDTVTKHTVKVTQKMLRHRNAMGETYLHWACKKGDEPVVKRLIEAGMDINVSDNAGWTALHEAVLAGYVDVVKQLLREGADVNSVGLSGVTPLHVAVSSGQYEVVKLLLEYGSNPHDKNVFGKGALDLADCENIKRLLLTFEAPLVVPREPNQPSMQGSEHLAFEQIQQDSHSCKSPASVLCPEDEINTRDPPRSGVNYKDNYFQQPLQEVEQKQIEMGFWEMKESEDGDRFAEIQTVLSGITKQQAEMFHFTKRTSPDLFHEDKSNEHLLELASQQTHLRTLLQKQNEPQHKLKMSREQRYSHISSIGISELNSTQFIQPLTHSNKPHYIAHEHNYTINVHSDQISQSVSALLSERAVTTDDSMTLGNLIRKEVIQPGDKALELAQMMKDTSKSLQNCSLTCGANAGNEPPHLQIDASKPSCTGFPFKESLTKEIFMGISSIHLIRDEEFLPCYMMARYWDLFIQSEEWDF